MGHSIFEIVGIFDSRQSAVSCFNNTRWKALLPDLDNTMANHGSLMIRIRDTWLDLSTVSQITSTFNAVKYWQHSHQFSLTSMGYKGRIPSRMFLLILRHLTQYFTWDVKPQIRSLKDCQYMVWSDESWFLLIWADARV